MNMPTKTNPKTTRTRRILPPCGLCGKRKKPRIKTECCGNWICDDEGDYVLFSYARNCCARNHRRFTLCGFHHTEEHPGDWKTCAQCREAFTNDLEMYVWHGTNEYNFEKLEHPPAFKPTHCDGCGRVIRLPFEGYGTFGDAYACGACLKRGFDLKKAHEKKGR